MALASVVAIAGAHACLLLPSMAKSSTLRIVTMLTLACIFLAAELIANYFLITHFDPGEEYGKVIAVLLILDVLGTITIPLIGRFGTPVKPAAQ